VRLLVSVQDATTKARLAEVRQQLAALREELHPLRARHDAEKSRVEEVRALHAHWMAGAAAPRRPCVASRQTPVVCLWRGVWRSDVVVPRDSASPRSWPFTPAGLVACCPCFSSPQMRRVKGKLAELERKLQLAESQRNTALVADLRYGAIPDVQRRLEVCVGACAGGGRGGDGWAGVWLEGGGGRKRTRGSECLCVCALCSCSV
jgi:hypothetical protein